MRPTLTTASRALGLLALGAALLGAGGCLPPRAAQPEGGQQAEPQQPTTQQLRREQVRRRPPINTSQNRYEGTLWRGTSSWGNLMRDHRARFRGDLLTVRDMQSIVNVPEPPPEPPPEQQQQQQEEGAPQRPVDPVLAFLREQQERRKEIQREQNEILRSINQVEVEVQRVLANGNLAVRGTHPPIFRDQNRVKYLFTLQGIVRPSDVADDNTIPASKLYRAEYRIRRLVKRSALPPEAASAARAAGRPREGALLDRLTNFLTAPGSPSTTQQPQQQ